MNLLTSQERIAIFGSRGMAGSAISRALFRHGYENQLLPDRSQLDCLDRVSVREWMKSNRPDIVILTAAKVGGIKANNDFPADFLIENLKIQTNVIENAWEFGVRRLLFLGSSCIYPKITEQPIREEALLSSPLEATNQWYAIAKIAGIKLCESLRIQHNFDAICLMPTNLYGTGDNYHPTKSHVIPALIRRFHEAKVQNNSTVVCWGSGSPLREFLHANDLGEACVFSLENWSSLAENAPCDDHGTPLTFLNVGTGIDITIQDLSQKIAEVVGFNGKILWDTSKPDGTPQKRLDVSRLKRMGWRSSIPLSDGLAMAYQDFQNELAGKRLRE